MRIALTSGLRIGGASTRKAELLLFRAYLLGELGCAEDKVVSQTIQHLFIAGGLHADEFAETESGRSSLKEARSFGANLRPIALWLPHAQQAMNALMESKNELNQFLQKHCKRPLTKSDIEYKTSKYGMQYQAIAAEKSAAQQALLANSEMVEALKKEQPKRAGMMTAEERAAKRARTVEA
eukprot:symbB.v1.2.003214.t1/scaffold166.1/size289592/16